LAKGHKAINCKGNARIVCHYRFRLVEHNASFMLPGGTLALPSEQASMMLRISGLSLANDKHLVRKRANSEAVASSNC
jgi:hypothetical protein